MNFQHLLTIRFPSNPPTHPEIQSPYFEDD